MFPVFRILLDPDVMDACLHIIDVHTLHHAFYQTQRVHEFYVHIPTELAIHTLGLGLEPLGAEYPSFHFQVSPWYACSGLRPSRLAEYVDTQCAISFAEYLEGIPDVASATYSHSFGISPMDPVLSGRTIHFGNVILHGRFISSLEDLVPSVDEVAELQT